VSASHLAQGLAERALGRLRGGPLHTLDLARDVLGLSGPPSLMTTAVSTLLGSDARFRVDAVGVWSLVESGATPLADLSYAVVDVETTGGSFTKGDRIIEIAIAPVVGGQVGEVWSTLINPGRWLPHGVQYLTGISQGMLAAAPYFDHVAHEVAERLEGRVFVAQNVSFDWKFVSAELANAAGDVPSVRRLCTIRMARRLLPEVRRRNLDALAHHFGIPNHARHRADGDALATARVLVRLLEEARTRGLADWDALDRFLAGGPPRASRRRRALPGGPTSPALPETEKRGVLS